MSTETEDFRLWILWENDPSPEQFKFTQDDLDSEEPNLADLAAYFYPLFLFPSETTPKNLEFFFDDNSIRAGTLLSEIIENITDQSPLVVRYPLSNDRVYVRYSVSNSLYSTTLQHNTGMWHLLRQIVSEKFETLQDCDPDFYFFQQLGDGKDGDEIENALQFNDIVEDAPTKGNKREISVGIGIRERRPYGEYTLEKVSNMFIGEQWDDVGMAPSFDIETLPQLNHPPSDADYKFLIDQLKSRMGAFGEDIPNEAISREFTSIFINTAVYITQKLSATKYADFKHQDLQLGVKECLNGTHGYGRVDYSAKFQRVVIMVNEVVYRDFDKGAAQNIVQMHSALEKMYERGILDDKNLDESDIPVIMYGIVTTAASWRFIRWAGSLDDPVIQISREYNCGEFIGEMEGSKKVLSYIIRILLSQISGVLDPTKWVQIQRP